MTSLPRLPERHARTLRPRDTDLARTSTNASDDGEFAYTHQNDTISLYHERNSVSTAVLKSRALQIRDILSTFSRHNFPSEYVQAHIFDRIAMLEGPKAIEDCVEKEDLVSTIFLLAVNNWAQYRILRHVLPEDVCAQHFQQKLQRRINAQIGAFDELEVAARSANPPSGNQINGQLGTIAAEFKYITSIIEEDRGYRQQGEVESATCLIYMMQSISRRNYRLGEGSEKQESLSGDYNSNLFQILFGNTANREARFGLDALKAFSEETITEQYKGLDMVRDLLVDNDVSHDYINEFDEIVNISGR